MKKFILLFFTLTTLAYAIDLSLFEQATDLETDEFDEYSLERAQRLITSTQVPTFTNCSDNNLSRGRIRGRYTDLTTLRNVVFTSDSPDQSLIQIADQKLEGFRALLREIGLCQFQSDIQAELARIGSAQTQNREFIEQLQSISTCFQVNEAPSLNSGVFSFARETFDSIFEFFWGKAQNENLTDEDCNVLRQTHSVWSSFYEADNQSQLQDDSPEIPLYNVNPHDSSYFYWMQERVNGNIPPQGLALLHVDTHTDLGHIHQHQVGSGLDAIPFNQFDEIYSAVGNNDRSQVLIAVQEALEQTNFEPGVRQRTLNFFRDRSLGDIRDTMNTAVRNNVHEIAQPIIGGVTTGLTSSVTMFLGPWSRRIEESTTFDDEGRVVPLRVDLHETVTEDDERVLTPRVDITKINANNDLGVTAAFNSRRQYLNPVLPFDPATDAEWTRPSGISFDLSVARITSETQSDIPGETTFNDDNSNLRPVHNYLPEQAQRDGFILDIDLDAFVSNGTPGRGEVPVSFGRSSPTARDGGHENSNETATVDEVMTTEISAIQTRIDTFFDRLEASRDAGYLPKVITIADSTTLLRALEGQVNDSEDGGNFTPSCLVFLLNYMVRQRLNELYNVRGAN